MDFLRPILARLIASAVAGLAVYLAQRWNIILDADAQGHLIESSLWVVLTVFSVIYSMVHKGINWKINPLDGAKPTVSSPDAGRVVKAQTNEYRAEVPQDAPHIPDTGI